MVCRSRIREDEPPVGSGNYPRFALFSEDTADSRFLLSRYPDLLESSLRKPFTAGGIWLVRPDGYIAVSAKSEAWSDIDAYLKHLSSAG
jgi:hypothetical protein